MRPVDKPNTMRFLYPTYDVSRERIFAYHAFYKGDRVDSMTNRFDPRLESTMDFKYIIRQPYMI